MKNSIKSVMIGSSLLAAVTTAQAGSDLPAPVTAAKAESKLEFSVNAGYHSSYEFRGVNFGDNMVDAGFELSTPIGGGFSLTAGAWYADVRSAPAANELDLYVAVEKSFGKLDLSVGYTYYAFPDSSGAETHELFVGVGTELSFGTSLSLTYFSDFDEIDGDYLEFDISHSFDLCEKTSLDISVGAAWSFAYNGDVDGGSLDGFNHWYAKAAVPIPLSSNATLTPYIKYVDSSSSLVSDLSNGTSDDYFVGGISLSYSF